MINLESGKKIIIAGPCAAETHSQVVNCAKELKKRKIDGIRACLWKPRTQPGFEGIAEKGIPWLAEAAEMRIAVATEVMLPEHVTSLVEGLNQVNGGAQMILWIGSRNQNHLIQKQIAQRLLTEGPETALLMLKNQPWLDERHWLGIFEHIIAAGFPKERVLLCHRGFSPNGNPNPNSLRNMPDFEMAMRVKEKTGRPMLLDPSHIGGSQDNVFKIVKKSLDFNFNGFMVEVHPNPAQAFTDARQQLNINQFDKMLKLIQTKEA